MTRTTTLNDRTNALSGNPGTTRVRWSSRAADDEFTVEDPATGRVITTVQGSGPAQVDAAVRAAHEAWATDWRWRSTAERARLLLRCADVLEEHADELAALESRENGKPVADARMTDINFLIGVFRLFGSTVDQLPSEFYDQDPIYASVVYEPVGVVGAIVPFNWPPIHTGGKVAPALAAGNTVVVKPSEQAPLTIMRIVELCNTVLPDDVLHVLPGLGASVGAAVAGMLGTPFGGTKHSGFGREHALETLKEFSAPKMIRFPSGLGTAPSWRAVTDVYGTTAPKAGA